MVTKTEEKVSTEAGAPEKPVRNAKSARVVRYLVSGALGTKPAGKSGAAAPAEYSVPFIVKKIINGLPSEELDDLQHKLAVPKSVLADLLGISVATLHRRGVSRKLGMAESDRLVRYARLMGIAVQVLETEEGARRWLGTPQVGLGGEIPLEYARTELGAREVEALLGRMDQGVY